MSFTPFGLVFLPIVALLLALRRQWLLPLLVVSAAMHAPAVAIVGSGNARPLGLTPWLVVSAAVFVHLFALIVSRRRVELGTNREVRLLFAGWSAFCAWAVVSAFTLPFLFAGLPTYNHEVMDSIAHGTEPLTWRPVYAVLAVNVVILWMHFLYLLQLAPGRVAARQVAVGMACAGVLALVATLAQRMLVMYWPEGLAAANLSLNPSYSQVLTSFGFGTFFRANWPFSEPSYASVWFAAFYAAGLGLAFFSRRPLLGVATVVVSGLGLVNTLGGSGIASAGLATLLLSGAAIARWFRTRDEERRRLGRRLIVPLALLVLLPFALWGLRQTPNPDVKEGTISTDLVGPRLADGARGGNTRTESNRVALRLLADSYGLGVGLGATRASSFALNLASNLGVVGTVLFFVLLARQVRAMHRLVPEGTARLFIEFGLLGMLAGAIAGIPDIAWPALWVWILGSFALIATAVSAPVGDIPSTSGRRARGS